MIKLFLDTSQSLLICCLQKNDSFFERIIPHSNQLGSVLSQEIINLFEEAQILFSDLEEVRVGIGPGSYTGTRVGVAFCEALAFGLSIKLIKIPSLAFFLKKNQTELALKSNFDVFCCIKKEHDLWHYELKPLSELQHNMPIINPKELVPKPDWATLSELKTATVHQDLLYFSVK